MANMGSTSSIMVDASTTPSDAIVYEDYGLQDLFDKAEFTDPSSTRNTLEPAYVEPEVMWPEEIIKMFGLAKSPSKRSKIRQSFQDKISECLQRGSICHHHLELAKLDGRFSGLTLRPNCRNIRLLDCLLRQDDCARNPYLKWSRQDLMLALTKRGIQLPEEDLQSRYACRVALEKADDERQFRFMELPKEVRMIVYEKALSQSSNIQPHGMIRWPALLCVSHQVRKEARQTFLRHNRFRLCINRTHWKQLEFSDKRSCSWLSEYGMEWVENITVEQVAELRHISFTHSSGRGEFEIDLTCPQALKWSWKPSPDFVCSTCQLEQRKTLGENLESIMTQKEREELRELMRPGPRSFVEEYMTWYLQEKEKQWYVLRKDIETAQDAMDEFHELCGKGRRVRPTLKGLAILAHTADIMFWGEHNHE